MADALITTKLGIPRKRPNLVPRPRLDERLEEGVRRKLLLVSAPAGFGKTTLLSEWLRRRASERSVAWVSLDETDCDPARLLSYLVAALRSVEEGIGEGVLAALRSSEPLRIEAVAGALVNELSASPREFVLVLDDYHVIDSQPIHDAIAFLLEYLPPNAHLAIASRAVPPLPLAKLRARDQMTELGVAELSFTTEEATAFLRDVMRLDLSAQDVATLEERTEGWVAGLQLAALSMRRRPGKDVASFIASFSGSNRGVLDFLAEEVLGRQPRNVREFLLMTSVLGRLTGPLCDALTGQADGDDMLERLERENLFVVALDEERRWYRYHRLFADVLRGRLERERPEQGALLHLRASAWCEENRLVAEAIQHALSGGDHDRAARLIEEGVEGAMERGEGTTALRWLEAVPPEAKRRRPRLFVEHAVALMITGRPNDTDPFLQEAERAAEASGEGENGRFLLGFALAVRSWRARLRGDAAEAVELARRALSLLPDSEAPVRNYAAVRLGDALRAVGDLATADEAYAGAAGGGIERYARHAYGRLAGMVMHARVQAERGRLREADEAFRRALRQMAEEGFEQSPAAAIAHIGLADLNYEWNDLDGAEREMVRGVELAELSGDVSTLVWAYTISSRVKRTQGDEEGALASARQADRVARDSGADLQIAIATSWMARLRLAVGDLAEAVASEWQRVANASAAAWMANQMTTARLLHAQGRHHEAQRLLEHLREATAAKERTRDLVEILALQVVALWASGEKERAVSALVEVLTLAAPEGYVRTFADEGQPMAGILSRVLETRQRGQLDSDSPPHFPANYVKQLLAALERDTAGRALAVAGLPEPLSERESEVLTLIAAGRTNRQIAGALFVTVGTVKTHLNNIYRKLGAHSRTQALARARELNLL